MSHEVFVDAEPTRSLVLDIEIENLLRTLETIEPGWAGAETVGPSPGVVADMRRVFASIPANIMVPDCEVDPDDGSVCLRWDVGDNRLSLTFCGHGSVTGYLCGIQVPARKYQTDDPILIASLAVIPSKD